MEGLQPAPAGARKGAWEIAPEGGDTAAPRNLAARLALLETLRPDLERLRVTRQGSPVELTPTEFRLLRYLVTHPDRPLG